MLIGEFNAEFSNASSSSFYAIHKFKSLIGESTCCKNPHNLTCIDLIVINSLHKKWSFPLQTSSVNVTKSAVTFTEEICNEKLHFLCSNCHKHFQVSSILETGLSDFHKMVLTL